MRSAALHVSSGTEMSKVRRLEALTPLIDQILFSGATFLFTVGAARTLGSVDFGLFALMYAAVQVALGTVRTLVVDPGLIALSNSPDDLGKAMSGYLRMSILVAAGVAAIVSTMFALFTLPQGFIAAGTLFLCIPLLCAYDSLRLWLVGLGWQRSVLVADGVIACGALGIAVMRLPPALGTFFGASLVVAAWGALECAVLITLLVFHRPPSGSIPWAAHNWKLGFGLAADYWAQGGLVQVSASTLVLVTSLTIVGEVRLVQTAFGFVTILLQAALTVGLPQAVRAAKQGPRVLRRHTVRAATVVVCGCIINALVLYVLPTGVLVAIFGKLWLSTARLVPIMLVMSVIQASVLISALELRATARVGALLRIRLVTAPVQIGLPLLLAWPLAGVGAIVGYAGTSLIAAGLGAWALRNSPAPARSPKL